ncbi:response regulator [Roseomonas sp. ACRSG]|nr:response regulator [Roseomonas sp. ACRSG]
MRPEKRQIVLVVEDEPIQRMMAVDLVKEAGFEAVEATDATQAVAILERRTDIRIVFTDIDMPRGMDGMKLAAMIRDRWPPIELILISGRFHPRMEELPARGVFFSKPYREQDIINAMQRMAG